MKKPDIESIEGLLLAISIDQKQGELEIPVQQVGTVTEIYDLSSFTICAYGDVFCPNCGAKISKQTYFSNGKIKYGFRKGDKINMVLAPLVRGRKGEYIKLFEKLKKDGYVRVRVDGEMTETLELIILDKNKKHTIEAVIDRLIIKKGLERRLADSFQSVFALREAVPIMSSRVLDLA